MLLFIAPLKGIPSRNSFGLSQTSGFKTPSNPANKIGSNLNKTISRMSVGGIKRDGGIKLLDITEQPIGRDSKRRKKVTNEENNETKQKENEKLEAESSTPDYAAGLTSIVPPSPAPYAPPATPAPQPTLIPSETFPQMPSQTQPQQTTAQTSQQRFVVNVDNLQSMKAENNLLKPESIVLTTTSTTPTTNTSTPLQFPPQIVQQVQAIRPQPPQAQQQPQPQPQPQQQPFVKRQLQLSREQMLEAQEMFNNSNKVTRPEKALILGFMAGSRENPCPQLGNVVTIKLSENEEDVRQTDGSVQKMIVETHFQMNYNTGEWKRVQKFRKLDQQQMQTLSIQGYQTLQQSV